MSTPLTACAGPAEGGPARRRSPWSRLRRFGLAAALALAALSAAHGPAAAETVIAAGLDARYLALVSEELRSGAEVGAHVRFALNDTWSIVGGGDFAVFPETGAGVKRLLGRVGAGIQLAIDELRIIPCVTVQPSFYVISGDPDGPSLAFGLLLGVGADYMLTRRVRLGVDLLQYHLLITDFSLDYSPSLVSTGNHVDHVWD